MLIEKLEYIESTGSRSGLNFGGASRRFRLPESRTLGYRSRVILAAPPFAAAVCRAGRTRTIFPAATVPGHTKTRQPEKSRGSTPQLPHGFKGRPSPPATADRQAPGVARGVQARNVAGPGKRGEAIWLPERRITGSRCGCDSATGSGQETQRAATCRLQPPRHAQIRPHPARDHCILKPS